jgi:hypothetical protein
MAPDARKGRRVKAGAIAVHDPGMGPPMPDIAVEMRAATPHVAG